MKQFKAPPAVLAVDLGGTKLAVALVDQHGNLLAYRQAAVVKEDWYATARQIETETAACLAGLAAGGHSLRGTGVIVPGIASQGGTVWAPNLWGDCDAPLGAHLLSRLPAPVVIESDRSGYVLGEQWLGAARGARDVVFVAVGTGIGVGVLAGGVLLRGAAGIAGAAGWMALTPESNARYQRVGCWEAEAAGPALARKAGRPTAEEAVAAARAGDPRAREAIADVARWLGLGVANLVSLFNPEIVVLGGGLMAAGEFFLDTVRRIVLERAQPRSARMARIELSRLGPEVGLLGAARLAFSATNASVEE